MYDLVIKGGRVIDPSQKIDGPMDVAVSGGKIAGVLPDIPPGEAGTHIDAAARSSPPGLIDMHTHVCDGVLNNGANPDVVGVDQGVTTVVDAAVPDKRSLRAFPGM